MTTAAAGAGTHLVITGTGPRHLVALHGLGADHRQPLQLLDDTVLREFTVVAVDLRAHGDTQLPLDTCLLTFDQLAADVEQVLAQLNFTTIACVGISMGAGVALRLAARGQLDIEALALVRPAWLTEPHPPNLAPFPRIAQLMTRHSTGVAKACFRLDRTYREVAHTSVPAAAALLEQFDSPHATERAARLSRLPADAPLTDKELRHLSRRAATTLVLSTDRDPLHPLATAAALAARLGANLRQVAARYESPDRHTSEARRALARFFGGTTTTAAKPARLPSAPGAAPIPFAP